MSKKIDFLKKCVTVQIIRVTVCSVWEEIDLINNLRLFMGGGQIKD